MPAGTTLTVYTDGISSCDADKIKIDIQKAGFDCRAQEATFPGYYQIEKMM